MLAIRMQRVGRKGYAQFRVIVQDSHRSPAAGKIVEYLGSYNPHTKETRLDKESIEKYLKNGAQPSNRVAILLKKEGYKLPSWVEIDTSGKRKIKNAEKLRKNQPKDKKPPKEATEPEAKAEEIIEELNEEAAEEVEEELAEEIVEEVAEKVIEEEAEKIVEEKAVEDATEKKEMKTPKEKSPKEPKAEKK